MGTLADDDAAAFEEHLLVCGRCMASVEAAEEYVRAMRGAARELRARGRRIPVSESDA